MTLSKIKTEIESKTNYRFAVLKDSFYCEALSLIGLPKKQEIKVVTGKRENGTSFISLNGNNQIDGYGGFGIPCDNVGEVIKWLDYEVKQGEYKYTQPNLNEQLSFI